MRIQVHRRIKERHGYAIQTTASSPRQIMGIVLGVICRHSAFHEIVTLLFIASNRTTNPLCCNTLTNLGSAYVRQTFSISVLCVPFPKSGHSEALSEYCSCSGYACLTNNDAGQLPVETAPNCSEERGRGSVPRSEHLPSHLCSSVSHRAFPPGRVLGDFRRARSIETGCSNFERERSSSSAMSFSSGRTV